MVWVGPQSRSTSQHLHSKVTARSRQGHFNFAARPYYTFQNKYVHTYCTVWYVSTARIFVGQQKNKDQQHDLMARVVGRM